MDALQGEVEVLFRAGRKAPLTLIILDSPPTWHGRARIKRRHVLYLRTVVLYSGSSRTSQYRRKLPR